MDQSPVGALLLDPALRVAWANDTFCDLFGLTRSELIGRGFADVVQQELKDLVEEPDVVESSLLEAYASAAEASPFELLRPGTGRPGSTLDRAHLSGDREEAARGGACRLFLWTLHAGRASPLLNTPRTSRNSTRSWSIWLAGAADRGGRNISAARVAKLAAGALQPDRWELWSLGEPRTQWTLGHLSYAKSRQETSPLKISSRQTGPYLRALDQVPGYGHLGLRK